MGKKQLLAERRPCPDCGREYGRDTITHRWSVRCDDCKRVKQRQWDKGGDPEKRKASRKAWYEANKDRHHTYMAEYRVRRSDIALTARAKRRGAEIVETFTPEEIYKRDKYTCQICHLPVERDKVAPHSQAPTIDHIVDIIDGGEHSRANVQTAHFTCNNRKSRAL